MKLDLNRAQERLGQEHDFTLRVMAEGHWESTHVQGWQIGAGKWSDPPGALVIVPAITAVVIYLSTDGDLFGVLDQYPQPDQPLWETFAYKGLPMWTEAGDTLEDLRARLYLRNAEHHATDLAITEAQHTLAPLNEEETP
jgi:hypothetical protein